MKKIEKLMALSVFVAALAMVGCGDTVEGMKKDTADAVEATEEAAEKAAEKVEEAAEKTEEAAKPAAE